MQALVLLVPMRLGAEVLNPIYASCLKVRLLNSISILFNLKKFNPIYASCLKVCLLNPISNLVNFKQITPIYASCLKVRLLNPILILFNFKQITPFMHPASLAHLHPCRNTLIKIIKGHHGSDSRI